MKAFHNVSRDEIASAIADWKLPRKKRVLEELPVAPPLPPREPTAAELEQQAQNDAKLKEHLKFRLGPILQDLKRRFKRFSKPINVRL